MTPSWERSVRVQCCIIKAYLEGNFEDTYQKLLYKYNIKRYLESFDYGMVWAMHFTKEGLLLWQQHCNMG
jgi:hypothetical protein